MKHPILYRIVFYTAFIALCASVYYLSNAMNYAPFKSSDMRNAYYDGCNFGGRPLTDEHIAECSTTADTYKETLDDIDRQMEGL